MEVRASVEYGEGIGALHPLPIAYPKHLSIWLFLNYSLL